MHAMLEASVRLIRDAKSVEVLLFSPEGDPLGTVEIPKLEAFLLVCPPVTIGYVHRAAPETGGTVFVEAVDGDDLPL